MKTKKKKKRKVRKSKARFAVKRKRNPEPVGTKRVVSSINSVWFRECILKSGLNQRQIADSLNLDPSQVSILLSGRRRMQVKDAVALSDLLGEPLDAVLMNAGVEIEEGATRSLRGFGEGSIEITGHVGDDLIVHLESGGVRGQKLVPSISSDDEGVRVLRIQTAGSKFSGIDGGLVYYRENDGVEPSSIGKAGIVHIKGRSEVFMRVVRRGYSPGKFDLSLFDGQVTHPDVVLESVSPILWLKLG